jgi:hypothetical protein
MEDRGLRFAEAWFRLLADAARGTRTAQSTIRSLADGELTPEKLTRQISRWLPAGVAPPSADLLKQWTEDLWSTIGVVPRSRYVELLERYEALRARLEEAEVTIRRLKRLLSEKGHEGDAQKVLDLWSNAVGETLKSQAEWMRTWIGGSGEAPSEEGAEGESERHDERPTAAPKRRTRRKP